MAAFYFNCKEHGEFGRIMSKVTPKSDCPVCGVPSKRAPRPLSTSTNEVLDNGLMSRRVERIQGATQLYKERAKADKRKLDVQIVSGKLEVK